MVLDAKKKNYQKKTTSTKSFYITPEFEISMNYLTNKEASTVLCSVVKHAGSGRARKKCRGKHET